MEFDPSKENIQPLRGGRNVTQLEVALHAQTDSEFQKELLQQKEAFEEAIRTYEGDDPLDNWYNYISWVEQSYPKHGHEGNLVALLEDCLSKFENDGRYVYDRRICKLWIKFIDLQQNPLELFQILHSKGICVSCADLYRAWAYYHEVSGDYKRADAVFQLGVQALAQPYEELVAAHQNFFSAIGKQAIHGVDERRLVEQRHAMTSLRSYTHKHRTLVTSSRTGSQVRHATPGILLGKENSAKNDRASNVPLVVYEDEGAAGSSIGTGAASMSILAIARKQDIVHKENALKPTPWNLKKNIITPKVAPRTPAFKVHEDELATPVGIQLPSDFAPMNHDDFSDWIPVIYFAEVPNPNARPMYPKNLVYAELNVEYSPEEIRARQYINNQNTVAVDSSVNMQETTMENASIITSHALQQHAMNTYQSIQPAANASILAEPLQVSYQTEEPPSYQRQSFLPQNISSQQEPNNLRTPSYIGDSFNPRQSNLSQRVSVFHSAQKQPSPDNLPPSHPENYTLTACSKSSFVPETLHQAAEIDTESIAPRKSCMPQNFAIYEDQEEAVPSTPKTLPRQWTSDSVGTAEKQQWVPNVVPKGLESKEKQVPWPNNTLVVDNNYTVNQDINYIWKDDSCMLPETIGVVPKPQISTFQIHEDSKLIEDDVEQKQPEFRKLLKPIDDLDKPDFKAPRFSVLSDSTENNVNKHTPAPSLRYRKSVKTPFSSQPLPEPPVREYSRQSMSQNFLHPSEIREQQPVFNLNQDNPPTNFNDSCTTQTFNFDMNAYKSSTPYHNKKAQPYNVDATIYNIESQPMLRQSKKILFEDNDTLKETSFVQPEEIGTQEKLSIILETTKEYVSSSSSSSSCLTFKTTTFNNRESLRTIPESASREDSNISSITQSLIAKNQMPCPSDPLNDGNEDVDINKYNSMKNILKIESPVNRYEAQIHKSQNSGGSMRQSQIAYDSEEQSQHVIDLTEDDDISNMTSNRFSEIGGGDASNYQKQSKTNFEFPSLKEAYNFDSNTSMGSSPIKDSRMEVDANHYLSQNYSSEFKMDYDSCPRSATPFDETILQNPADPFSSELKQALLNKINFPKASYAEYYIEQQSLPRIFVRKECVTLGDEKYTVEKAIGRGAFASVYKAKNINTKNIVALKCQKPPDVWEFYITKEIRERLTNSQMLNAFMDATYCFTSRTCSILISDFCQFGSLLDVRNKVKLASNNMIKELVTIYFTSEILTIVNTLHQCGIIHGDIKPDNFLVMRMPPQFGYPTLRLIDYGCSIDMSLFPQGTTFTKVISTENFTCTEMKDGRPWTYQTDIFCVAATIHALLFEGYMVLKKPAGVWLISQRIPRYMRTELWKTFFFQLLNIESCDKLPDLNIIKAPFDTIVSSQSEELQIEMRFMANCVLGR